MKRALIAFVTTTALVVGTLGGLYVLHRPTPGVPVFSYVGVQKTRAAIEAKTPTGWEVVSIGAGDASLVGYHRPPAARDEERHAYVLHFVGNGEDALAEATAFLVAADVPKAFGILTVAPRGFDASVGSPSVDGLATDADRMLDHAVKDLNADVERSVFSGFSMGALYAFRASAARPDQSPNAVAAFAPFAVVDVLAPAGPFSRFLPLHRFDTLRFAARSRAPALVVSGVSDGALDATHHKRVVAACANVDARTVEADHAAVALHPESLRAFRALLDANDVRTQAQTIPEEPTLEQ